MNTYENEIYEYINRHVGTTCVELYNLFGKGTHVLRLRKDLIVGFGLSEDLAEVLTNLTKNKVIVMAPTSPLTYAFDGGMISLPLANRFDKEYKKDHWVPVAFYTKEYADKRSMKYIKMKE